MEGLLPIFVIALVLIFKASLGKRKVVVPEWEGNEEEVESEIAGDHKGRPHTVKGEELEVEGETAGGYETRPYTVKSGELKTKCGGALKTKCGGDGQSIARGFREDARRAFIYSEIFNKKYD